MFSQRTTRMKYWHEITDNDHDRLNKIHMYCHTAGCAGMLTPFRICCSSHSRSWSLVSLRCSEYNKHRIESLYNWEIIYRIYTVLKHINEMTRKEKNTNHTKGLYAHTNSLTYVNITLKCKQQLAKTNRKDRPYSVMEIQQY